MQWVLGSPWIVVACLALAGCTDDATVGNGPSKPGDPPPAIEWTPVLPANETEFHERPSFDFQIFFQDCLIRQSAIFFGPLPRIGSTPEGWEATGYAAAQVMLYEHYQCGHFAWLGFERPDVEFVLEGHRNTSPPPDCHMVGVRSAMLVERMWIDDEDLRDAFASSFAFPVHNLTAEVSAPSSFDEQGVAEVAWSDSVNATSTLVVPNFYALNGIAPYHIQVFMPTAAGGIAIFNSTGEMRHTGWGSQLATVEAYPPLLLAEIAEGVWPGAGNTLDIETADWSPLIFSDLECQDRIYP